MKLYLKLLIILSLVLLGQLNASQKEVQKIAKLSSASLYNIDKNTLQKTIDAYVQSTPNLQALKIVEALSGEVYYQVYRDNGKLHFNKQFPNTIEQYNLFQTKAKYESEIVGSIVAYFKNDSAVAFTKEEKEFLAKNPYIVFGADQNWQPFDFKNRFGKHDGFNADLIRLLNEKLGTNIKIEIGRWGELQNKVKEKKIAGLLGPAKTNEREKYMVFTEPYFYLTQVILQRNNAKVINSLEQLSGKTIGLKSGSSNIDFFKNNYPDIQLKIFETNGEIIRAVSLGEIDFGLSNIGAASYEIQKNFISNIKVGFELNNISGDVRLGIRKDWPELASILQKGLDSISDSELNTLLSKWLKLAAQQSKSKKVEFSEREKEYLKKYPTIRLAYMNFWPTNDDGHNIHTEYVNLLSKYGNININLVKYDAWKDGFAAAKNGNNIQGILNLSWSKERAKNSFDYTKPYYFTPSYLIVKQENNTIKSINDLANKSIFLKENSITNQIIKELKFNISPIVLETEEAIHKALSKDDSKAQALLTYNLTQEFLDEYKLKITQKAYAKYGEVHIGTSKKHKELHSIIDKVFDAIPKNELTKIQNKVYKKTKLDSVVLTGQEQAWVRENPFIKVASMKEWKPFDITAKNGKHIGFHNDLLNLLNKKAKMNLVIVPFESWKDAYGSVIEKKVHAITSLSWTKEREKKYFNYSEPYHFTPYQIIVKKTSKIKSVQDLNNKKIAIREKSIAKKIAQDSIKNPKLVFYPTVSDVYESIKNGEVEATLIANIEQATLKKYDLKVVDEIIHKASEIHIGVNQEYTLLSSILDKAMEAITLDEMTELRQKWFVEYMAHSLDSYKRKIDIKLTQKEKEFLAKNPTIKVHNEKNWPPFNFYEFGQPKGYSVELIKLVAKNVGFDIEYVTGPTWDEFLTLMKKDQLDVITNIVQNEERDKYMLFTDPFMQATMGIAAHKDRNDIGSFNDILTKKVALENGFFYHDYFKKNHPDTELHIVDDGLQTLQSVAFKRADATIGFVPVMKYISEKNFINDLQFIADTSSPIMQPIALRFSVRKSAPELQSILQKGLASITPNQYRELSQTWLGMNQEKQKSIISLSEKEKAWLNNHKIIRFTADPSYLPYESFTKDGKYIGMASEYIKIIEKNLGIEFTKIPTKTWTESLDKAKNGEVDVLSNYTDDKTLSDIHISTKPYIKSPIAVFTKSDAKKVTNLSELKNKKVAVVKGYGYLKQIYKDYPKLNYVEVENAIVGMTGVSSGKYDAMICSLTLGIFKISDHGLHNLQMAFKTKYVMKLGLGIRKDWEPLVGIINKVIDSISKGVSQEITQKWLGNNNGEAKKIDLTLNEQAWIDKNIPVKYVFDPDWAPFEWKNDLGKHTGIVFDILSLISERTGLKLEAVPTNTWTEAVDLAKNKKVDMYGGLGENEDRKRYMNFTKNTLYKTPYVFVVKKENENDYFDTFNSLKKNEKVAVVDGYTIQGIMKDNRPDVKIQTVATTMDGFKAVSNGKIDIFLVNAATARYYINRKGFDDLKIATKTSYQLEIKSAIRKDWPIEVVSILDKAIESISEKELSDIYLKWTEIQVEQEIDWSLLYKFAAGALMVLAIIVYWNRKLKKAVDNKTKELSKLLDSFDENVIALRADLKGNIIYVSRALCEMSGYSKDYLIGKSHRVLKDPATSEEFLKNLLQRVKKEEIWRGESKNKNKAGEYYWVYGIITPEYDSEDNLIGYSDIKHDITAQKEVEGLSLELQKTLENFDENVIASRGDLKGIITYASDALCKISGYAKEELLGEPHSILRHPEVSKEVFKDMWETIQSGKVWKGEMKNKKKDGSFYWVQSIISPEFDEKQNIVSYTSIREDITAKKEVEELSSNLELKVIERTKEIDEQRTYTNAIMNSQNNIVISTDGESLRTANKAFFNFFSVKDVEEFLVTYGDCICDTFDTDKPDEFIQKMVDEEKWIDYVYNHKKDINKAKITRGGQEFIFSITADKFVFNNEELMVAVFNDITELEKIRKNVEVILSNILLPVLITSRKTRKILYANKYAEQQYETTLDEIIGADIDDIYSVQGQQEHILQELRTKGFVENFEEVFKTKKGKMFNALLSVAPIDYNDEESYIGMVTDITKQKELQERLSEAHKNTKDSIEYASLIQRALVPEEEHYKDYFDDYFAIWQPKDIVGGDIYLFEELRDKNECLVMVIDCTGHGVPGAFVTMLVKAIERQIVAKIESEPNLEVSPAWCLQYFNRTMKKLLNQEDESSISNAGFDGGVIYYNKKQNIIRFAGAETSLFYIENGELKTIKGNRHSIGYKKSDGNFQFTDYEIDVSSKMHFYLSTDGYLDQNGGTKGFPFGKKRFKNILLDSYEKPFRMQKQNLLAQLKEYQQDEETNDDITVFGFSVNHETDFSQTIITHDGHLSQAIIVDMANQIEKVIHTNDISIGLSSSILTVFIELSQNILKYGKFEDVANNDISSYGYLNVVKNSDNFVLESRNIISKEDREKIEFILRTIDFMSIDEVKKQYKSLRKSGKNAHEKGGGIGFYEIAKRVQNFEYEFSTINDSRYNFIFKVYLNKV